jgi:hypothetical protein
LQLGACSLRLGACSLVPDPGANASAAGKRGPLLARDGGSRYVLHVGLVVVNNHHAGLSLDPYFGAAAQWLVRTVYYSAGTVNLDAMPIVICLVSLHRNDRFTFTALRIAANHVLVYVYVFFHLYLSVCAQVRAVLRHRLMYQASGLI